MFFAGNNSLAELSGRQRDVEWAKGRSRRIPGNLKRVLQ